MIKHALVASAIAVAVFLSPGSAHAAMIQYDLTDLGAGQWQYDYFFTGSLDADQGFAIDFDLTASNLQLQPPATPDWDPLFQNPDPVLGSLGVYDALALVTNPAFSGPFSVSFHWTSAAAPANQNFVLYELDAFDTLVPFDRGVTTPRDVVGAPVPEPSTLLLLTTGLAAARRLRRKRAPSAL